MSYAMQYYAFVEEKQKVHCLNTLFSKVWTRFLFCHQPSKQALQQGGVLVPSPEPV